MVEISRKPILTGDIQKPLSQMKIRNVPWGNVTSQPPLPSSTVFWHVATAAVLKTGSISVFWCACAPLGEHGTRLQLHALLSEFFAVAS